MIDEKGYLEKNGWKFEPCPFCGSTDIGVKDTLVDMLMGNNCPCSARRKIWAYCRCCGAESGKRVADIVYDEEEIAVGVEMWNKRKVNLDGYSD